VPYKICPLFACFENAHTDRCIKDECAWWTKEEGCAVLMLAKAVRGIRDYQVFIR